MPPRSELRFPRYPEPYSGLKRLPILVSHFVYGLQLYPLALLYLFHDRVDRYIEPFSIFEKSYSAIENATVWLIVWHSSLTS